MIRIRVREFHVIRLSPLLKESRRTGLWPGCSSVATVDEVLFLIWDITDNDNRREAPGGGPYSIGHRATKSFCIYGSFFYDKIYSRVEKALMHTWAKASSTQPIQQTRRSS
jgi:hypothetical protein